MVIGRIYYLVLMYVLCLFKFISFSALPYLGSTMVSSVPLGTWVIILPARDDQNVNNLVATMQRVSRPLGFNINNETERSEMINS